MPKEIAKASVDSIPEDCDLKISDDVLESLVNDIFDSWSGRAISISIMGELSIHPIPAQIVGNEEGTVVPMSSVIELTRSDKSDKISHVTLSPKRTAVLLKLLDII